MGLRKLRLQRAWSQEHLAQVSGLSVRTIQRIERGQSPSLDSLKSLASVFEQSSSDLESLLCGTSTQAPSDKATPDMNTSIENSAEEQRIIEHVKELKGFYTHLITYVVVISFLLVINLVTSADYLWVIWPALGWGIGIVNHGLNVFEVFNLFGARWERKQIEKRLGRKL